VEAQLSHAVAETLHREPSALAVRGLSKTFASTAALTKVDLTVEAGEVHALLGENGSGKSTVIKILAGYHQPDHGAEVSVGGRSLSLGSADGAYAAGCRFVHQDLGLIDTISIADNLALVSGFPSRVGTVRSRELREAARRDLARAGLDLDPRQPVATLSPAERTGVAVARALREDPSTPVKLLVLDEPTATLPDVEVERLLTIVRNVASRGVGVLYVTHRLDEVFQVADKITVLRDGHRVDTVDVDSVDRAGLITMLVGSELEEIQAASAALPPEQQEPVLLARDIHGAHLDGVSLELRPGDVVGIAGITGSGRETLLSVLFGAGVRWAGDVTLAGRTLRPGSPSDAMRAGVAYIPAERKTLGSFQEMTTRENVSISDLGRHWRWPVLSRRRESVEVSEWVERLDVRPRTAAGLPLGSLSGGNQQKVVFAKWLRRTPEVLLVDEPTQGVDVGAKAELHLELLRAARDGAAIAVSSSDTDELAALCHRIVVLQNGRIVDHLTGSRINATEISRACLATDEKSTS
jgi:ribose transport system ATP-binding protein